MDVSPFEYNVSILKSDYKVETVNLKISPRRREELFVKLEKKIELKQIELQEITETAQEKIQRIREEKSYYALFDIWNGTKISFSELWSTLELNYITKDLNKKISRLKLVDKEDINAEYIYGSNKIFLKLANDYYILSPLGWELQKIPFEIDIKYIKKWLWSNELIIVTDKGSFIYNTLTKASWFQYLFKDYINYKWKLIWIIYKDEVQKRKNFDLEQTGNLILQYSQDTKERKVVYATSNNIDKIYLEWDVIIIEQGEKKLELTNID